MSDLPQSVMIWRSVPNLTHVGTWSTERYPAEAVEYVPARLEADERVQKLVEAATPFYAAVFNDNGDVTVSTGHISTADWIALDAAIAAIKEPKP